MGIALLLLALKFAFMLTEVLHNSTSINFRSSVFLLFKWLLKLDNFCFSNLFHEIVRSSVVTTFHLSETVFEVITVGEHHLCLITSVIMTLGLNLLKSAAWQKCHRQIERS
jgi:hypothetical protein